MEYLKESFLRGILLSHFTVITVSKRTCAIKVTIKGHFFIIAKLVIRGELET